MFACAATDDFFRSRIDHMIDLRHPLAVLASRMPWQEIEARVAQVFSRKGRAGVAMPDLDLFGEQVQRTAVLSNAGRPRVPLRIMIALLYLKHAFNESDEGVVERWGETPTWQFFSGQAYFGHHRPCDATTLIQALRFPCAGGGVHRQGQEPSALRVRCEGWHCQHAQTQPDRGSQGVSWQSI
jgi:IS5 family transposase